MPLGDCGAGEGPERDGDAGAARVSTRDAGEQGGRSLT